MSIDALTGCRNGLSHLLVETCCDRIARSILAIGTRTARIVGDKGTLCRTDSDDVGVYAFGESVGCGTLRIILMIFTIGDKNNSLLGSLVRCKTAYCQIDGSTDSCALQRHHARIYALEEHLGRHKVIGDGKLGIGLTCEYNETHLVVVEIIDKTRQHALGPFKTIGLDILSQHRIGDIETNHHLDAFLLDGLKFRAELRTGSSDYEADKGKHLDSELDAKLPFADTLHQRTQQAQVAKTTQGLVTAHSAHEEQDHESKNYNQQPKYIRIGKTKVIHCLGYIAKNGIAKNDMEEQQGDGS